MMKNITEFRSQIQFLLTDIDDTMTDEGLMGPEAYQAMWQLSQKGIHVIPVTGRPAGWCEMIARMWPVSGVIGENGGFYFRYDSHGKKMKRHFFFDAQTQANNRIKLGQIQSEVLSAVPGADIASDQFCRLMDLAVDFCEDVPRLPEDSVNQIVKIFNKHGATAKVSSIHVNGWFGDYNKLLMSLRFFQNEFNLSPVQVLEQAAFIGDSPNDEPMFEWFRHSFAVANIKNFTDRLQHFPKYVTAHPGGLGFAEAANQILSN